MRIIHRALDAGINFIDTADVYSRGESEQIVGKALAGGKRDSVVLATKVHGKMHDDDPNQFGNTRRWIVQEVENSLRRLGTDWIDLYQIHRPEIDTDIDETLGALTRPRARRQGSLHRQLDVPAEPDRRGAVGRRSGAGASASSASSRLTRCCTARSRQSVLPVCEKYRIGVIPWSPLAGGWLSGKYGKGGESPASSRRAQMIPARYDMSVPANQRKLEAAQALGELADGAGISLIEMALAFVMLHPAVTAPIIGPRTMEQLDSQLPALDTTAQRRRCSTAIDEIVPPGLSVNPDERGWDPPWLTDSALRRR